MSSRFERSCLFINLGGTQCWYRRIERSFISIDKVIWSWVCKMCYWKWNQWSECKIMPKVDLSSAICISSAYFVMKYLEEIAKTYQVAWEPSDSGEIRNIYFLLKILVMLIVYRLGWSGFDVWSTLCFAFRIVYSYGPSQWLGLSLLPPFAFCTHSYSSSCHDCCSSSEHSASSTITTTNNANTTTATTSSITTGKPHISSHFTLSYHLLMIH